MDVRILGATRLGCSVTRTADSVKVLCPSPVGGAALKRIDVSEGSESVSVHDEDGTPALSIAYREGVRAEASFLFGQYYELHARWLSGDTEPEFFGVFDGVKTELDHLRPQPAAVLAWLAKASMPIEDLTLIGCEYLDDAKGATLGKFIRRVRRRANTTEVVECYPRPWRTLHWGCTVWFHAKSGDDESSVGIRGKWLEDGFTRDRLTCLAAG
jgi:hypothetical protein